MCKILALLIFEKVRKCRIDGSRRLLSRPIRLATLKSNINAVAIRFEAVLLRLMEGRDARKLAGMNVPLDHNAKSCRVVELPDPAIPPPQ